MLRIKDFSYKFLRYGDLNKEIIMSKLGFLVAVMIVWVQRRRYLVLQISALWVVTFDSFV